MAHIAVAWTPRPFASRPVAHSFSTSVPLLDFSFFSQARSQFGLEKYEISID
jgi:hypothetical protein